MTRAPHSALASLFALVACLSTVPRANAQIGVPETKASPEPVQADAAPVVAGAVPESTTKGPDTSVEQTFRQADEQFQAANYAQAALLFTRVWQLAQSPEHRERWGRYVAIFAFNTATSHRLNRDCDAAFMAYSHYNSAFAELSSAEQQALRKATDLPADNAAWLQELTQECPASQATVTSVRPAPSDNPSPTKRAEIPLQPSGNWLLDVNLPSKAKTPVPKDTTETPVSHLGWILTAGGAASLAVSGYFLWSGMSNDKDATDPANKHERYTDYAARRDRDYVTASIIGGLGLGLASVGIYVLTTSNSSADNEQAKSDPRLWLFATGTQLGLGGLL